MTRTEEIKSDLIMEISIDGVLNGDVWIEYGKRVAVAFDQWKIDLLRKNKIMENASGTWTWRKYPWKDITPSELFDFWNNKEDLK